MPKPRKKTSLLGGLLARLSGRKEPPEVSGPLRPFQAISIYRKLGVTSRGPAVDAARGLGLLDE
jgi:hypothetical protein